MLSSDLGDLEGARRLFALGVKANKYHLRTYQAWATMEATKVRRIVSLFFVTRYFIFFLSCGLIIYGENLSSIS